MNRGQQPEALERNLFEYFKINVVGNIHLFNLFTPLILKGEAKKVIALSTGQADLDIIPKLNIDLCPAYAISKAGLNTAVAKFSAQYAKDGVLFMSICPGMVETGHFAKGKSYPRQSLGGAETDTLTANEEQARNLMRMLASFKEYAPHIEGPATPEDCAKDVMSVVNSASLEKGYGGSFLSHHGNKQWL